MIKTAVGLGAQLETSRNCNAGWWGNSWTLADIWWELSVEENKEGERENLPALWFCPVVPSGGRHCCAHHLGLRRVDRYVPKRRAKNCRFQFQYRNKNSNSTNKLGRMQKKIREECLFTDRGGKKWKVPENTQTGLITFYSKHPLMIGRVNSEHCCQWFVISKTNSADVWDIVSTIRFSTWTFQNMIKCTVCPNVCPNKANVLLVINVLFHIINPIYAHIYENEKSSLHCHEMFTSMSLTCRSLSSTVAAFLSSRSSSLCSSCRTLSWASCSSLRHCLKSSSTGNSWAQNKHVSIQSVKYNLCMTWVFNLFHTKLLKTGKASY